jgi:DnaJ-domain-containing protein 1
MPLLIMQAVSRPPAEQGFAAEQATRVNDAYSTLKSALQRANYMVGLSLAYPSETMLSPVPAADSSGVAPALSQCRRC